MDKIYIVTAGDSFTDSHMPFISSDDAHTYLGLKEKLTDYKEMCGPDYSLRYQYFLINELWEKKINFDYYNLGKGSAGNHVITHRYRTKIQELLDKGVNPNNIYGTIQLSGLVRQTDPIYEIEFDLKNVNGGEWDYINHMNPTVSTYKNVLEAHISNIEDIIQWNKDKGIEKFNIFFGWAVYYEDELNEYGLKERFDAIDSNYFFRYEYEQSIDVTNQNCVGSKKILKKIFGFDTKEKYIIAAGKYGGMTELIRDSANEEEYFYIAEWDTHLNTFGNYMFYKIYYRKLFENWKLLDDINLIENVSLKWEMFKRIFKINHQSFLQSYNTNFNSLPHKECEDYKRKIKEENYIKYFINTKSLI
jgi:hypothetical protein